MEEPFNQHLSCFSILCYYTNKALDLKLTVQYYFTLWFDFGWKERSFCVKYTHFIASRIAHINNKIANYNKKI